MKEKIQVYFYMIMTGLRKAHVIEHFKHTKHVEEVVYDPGFAASLLKDTAEAVGSLHSNMCKTASIPPDFKLDRQSYLA